MESKPDKSIFETLFVPDYDELSLFSMSYILILLIVFNSTESTWDFTSWSDDPGTFFIFLPFIIGMGLSIYHAFSSRKKTDLEKKIMVYFAALLNGFCGIWYGTYILVHNPGWELAIFPIWNICNGFILVSSVRGDPELGEKCISDENVSFQKLLMGTILVSIIFVICQLFFELIWAATFSICMVWISNLNRAVNSILLKHEILRL